MVSVEHKDDFWIWYHGGFPLFSHRADDNKMFRIVTSQLIVAGACRPTDVINKFGVAKRTVMRSVQKYREEGAEAFFKKRPGRKGGNVLTIPVLERAQQLLNEGVGKNQIAAELGILKETLRKAIYDGRLLQSGAASKAPNTGTTRV